jgi:hypothetical protein
MFSTSTPALGEFAGNRPFATPTGQASRKNVRGKPCRTTDIAVYSRRQDPPGRNEFVVDHDFVQTALEVSGVAYDSDCEGTLPKLPESCDENEGGPEDRPTPFEKDIAAACRLFFDDPEAVVVRSVNRGGHALRAEKGLAVSTTQYYETPDLSYYIENETVSIPPPRSRCMCLTDSRPE